MGGESAEYIYREFGSNEETGLRHKKNNNMKKKLRLRPVCGCLYLRNSPNSNNRRLNAGGRIITLIKPINSMPKLFI